MSPDAKPLDVDALQTMLWGFAAPRTITVAARTGMLQLLSERPHTCAELAEALELEPLATTKVARALTAVGLLEAVDEHYSVVPPLRASFAGGEEDLTPFLEHIHSMQDRWGENLEPWLRGQAWTTGRRTPAELERFGSAMRAMGSHVGRQMAAKMDMGNVRRMLDVGGGFGHYSRCLCDADPGLEATVLDIPEVCELARAKLAGSAVAERIGFLPGDYHTTDYGENFDLVLFANVLHQELAEPAAEMLLRGASALAPGGRVAVVDFIIDDEQRRHPFGTQFALNMRSFGDTYPEPLIRRWMEAAGLRRIERTDLSTFRWLIIGSKDE